MNTQNIAALTAMLTRTGFDSSIGYRTLQRICFNPGAFYLVEKIRKGKDVLTCTLYFERKANEYTCQYYDASFIKHIEMPERIINGIRLQELDLAMGDIDWQFPEDHKGFRLDNETSWPREKNIFQVVNDLMRLSATDDGKYFADALKVKHWSGAGLEELVGNFSAIRSRLEISQRVYFIDGESISVDEAYRFLLNCWMEKKMQAKRRDERSTADDPASAGGEGREKKLLLKKRIGKNRRQKV